MYFEADVPHVLHVPSYSDYLHEAFHVIFEALSTSSRFQIPLLQPSNPTKSHVSEIFAVLMSLLFVFRLDIDKFLLHSMRRYSSSSMSCGKDDCETVVRFTEVLIRLFIVVDYVTCVSDKKSQMKSTMCPDLGGGVETALQRFIVMVKNVGPWFSDYRRLFLGPGRTAAWEYMRRQFCTVHVVLRDYMPGLWAEAIGIYNSYVRDALCHKNGAFRYDLQESRRQVRLAMEEGRPVQRYLCEDLKGLMRSLSEDKNIDISEIGLDPLDLLCNLFYEYAQDPKETEGKVIHLFRSAKSSNVRFRKSETHFKRESELWSDFLCDKGATAAFCPVPSSRRKRLKKQIVMLKTLWDIESAFKSRRLSDIISDNWPKEVFL